MPDPRRDARPTRADARPTGAEPRPEDGTRPLVDEPARVSVTALHLPGADREELREAAHRLVVERVGAVDDASARDATRGRVTRLCPRCGSVAHGRPRVRGAHLGLSYADGLVLVAVSTVPVGVDVEPGRPEWARAEAVLKCTGDGLHGQPDETGLHVRPLPLPDAWVATRGPAVVLFSSAGRGAPAHGATG